jgi:hypothetical protein
LQKSAPITQDKSAPAFEIYCIYPDEQGDSRLIASVDTERIRENIRTEMKFFIEI